MVDAGGDEEQHEEEVEVPVARIDASKFTYHKLESDNFLGGPLDKSVLSLLGGILPDLSMAIR
jgi:hypothetical protein